MNRLHCASFVRDLLCAVVCCLSLSGYAEEKVALLAFGDWGWSNSPEQQTCAKQMTAYAASNQVKFNAALLLGDNFYHKMPGGVDDLRWQVEFEKAYDAAVLDMPFYAALGNHDYEGEKAQTQMEYARQHPEGRWKMPAKWYRVEIPKENPVVTVLVLDSNFARMKDSEWAEQKEWLRRELERKHEGKWLIATGHHPLYTAGAHGDTERLKQEWDKLFDRHSVDFFLCGHDHDLQHLEIPDRHTSFILAGGGGAKIRPIKRDDRGPFARATHGFFVLKLTPEVAEGEFISSEGDILHTFTRTLDGNVSTPSEK